MTIDFVYRSKTRNIGDLNCSPISYFDFPFEVNAVDLSYYARNESKNNYVFGGGAISNYIIDALPNNKNVIWGCGVLELFSDKQFKPKNNTLIGVRDYGYNLKWIPCVSCMSPLFDKQYEVKHEYVIYQHHSRNINLRYPKMFNNKGTFEDAIKFIGSGECVITNSYHGAYWGLLLGKKVFVMNELNDKIKTFKWKPSYCERNTLKPKNTALVYEGILEESREENIKFHKEVLEFLKIAF